MRTLNTAICWLAVWVWNLITPAMAQESQEVNTTDLTGYWVSESGVKVFIPVMRDGRMPVVLMNRRPTVLLGDWDWASQTLKVNNTHFGMADDKLTMSNQRTTQTHTLKRQVTAHPSDGYWFHENKGELIVADDGKKVWAIHIPPSQEATILKTKWKTLDEELTFKLDGKCVLNLAYEPIHTDLIWMICPNYEHDWVRIHTPSPFLTTDWSGEWNSDGDWTLYIDMDGQGFGKVYMESSKRIIDFKAGWLSGSQGQTVLLERRKESDAVLSVNPTETSRIEMRIDGKDLEFYR